MHYIRLIYLYHTKLLFIYYTTLYIRDNSSQKYIAKTFYFFGQLKTHHETHTYLRSFVTDTFIFFGSWLIKVAKASYSHFISLFINRRPTIYNSNRRGGSAVHLHVGFRVPLKCSTWLSSIGDILHRQLRIRRFQRHNLMPVLSCISTVILISKKHISFYYITKEKETCSLSLNFESLTWSACIFLTNFLNSSKLFSWKTVLDNRR